MAVAAALIPGLRYRVTSGMFEDEVVTIVNNIPFPDDHADRRKVIVMGPNGQELKILPRQLFATPEPPEPVHAPAPQAQVATVPQVHDTVPVVTDDVVPVIEAPTSAVSAPVATVQVATPALSVSNPITDVMDPRLDHLRPSKAKIRRYLSRDMGHGFSDVEFLLNFTTDAYRQENEGRPANIMLKGDTQSGKTFLVEVLAVKWAEALGLPKPLPIFTLSGSSGITDFDLFGQTTSYTDPHSGTNSLVWLPGVCELAAQVGGILYLDEVNAMGERVTSSLHPLADHRHTFVNRNKAVYKQGQFMPEVTVGSMDLWIIGTYNEGYRGMSEMNEAFINRFRHLAWGYDAEVERQLIKSPAIRTLGDAIRMARSQNTIRTPVGTSALQRVERDVHEFGIALGLQVFVGMFKAQERGQVESIIQDRSILLMLQEEAHQAQIEAEGDDE